MDNLVEFDRAKMVSGGKTPYWAIPKFIKKKYGITNENCTQFHIRYFHSHDSDDIILRIEKLPSVKEI